MCENRLKIRDMVLCATMSLKKVIIVLLCRQICDRYIFSSDCVIFVASLGNAKNQKKIIILQNDSYLFHYAISSIISFRKLRSYITQFTVYFILY